VRLLASCRDRVGEICQVFLVLDVRLVLVIVVTIASNVKASTIRASSGESSPKELLMLPFYLIIGSPALDTPLLEGEPA
jgi:hypothetical protein